MIPRRLLLSFGCFMGLVASSGPSAVFSAEEPKKLKSQTVKVHLVAKNGPDVTFEMLQLPAGKIILKDEKGKEIEHSIKPIWICKTEITWDVYDVFWRRDDMKSPWDRDVDGVSRPSKPFAPPDRGWGHDGCPASSFTLDGASKFCIWLSSNTGKKFRIPTEAEWEYACRAGGPPLKPDEKSLEKIAWFEKNADEQTHPVAKKEPNAWGLYDMLGNVAEYVIRDPADKWGLVAGGGIYDKAGAVHSGVRQPYNEAVWQRRDPLIPHSKSWLSDGGHVGLRVVMED